jgi:hypothetical protein
LLESNHINQDVDLPHLLKSFETKKTMPIMKSAPASLTRVAQIILASLPLLGVFIYFLYSAITRPYKPIYTLSEDTQDDAVIQEAFDETGPLIPLRDMIISFLVFEGLWLWLGMWCLVFIPKRRALMASYLESGETMLGDVVYKAPLGGWLARMCCCGGANYASIEYSYPNSSSWWIKKRVRVYERFSREKITIVKLLNSPYSGQPKADVEIDVKTSHEHRNESKVLAIISISWAIFCLSGAGVVCFQQRKLNSFALWENPILCRRLFLWVGCIGLPILVTLAVFLRWAVYRHWIVNQGKVYKTDNQADMLAAAAGDENSYESLDEKM